MEPQTPTQPKKKSGVLGWILIGCLGLALIFGILAVSCGLFVFNKGKKVVQDFEKNPAKAAAETMVRLNPELELVDSDEDAGTMTIRNKKTGEEFTADYSDIEEGKISFESDGKAVSFDARGAAEGGSGVITMTDEAGEQTAVIGGQGDSSAVPSWFPLYPGASDVGATYSAKNATEETGLSPSRRPTHRRRRDFTVTSSATSASTSTRTPTRRRASRAARSPARTATAARSRSASASRGTRRRSVSTTPSPCSSGRLSAPTGRPSTRERP
ncbi:MAG: hypothetical protein R2991_09670 [Thermoanaerobaculia bacterium]